MQPVFVYSTAPNEPEALSIARAILERKLAACANVLPGMTSLYWWEGKLEQAGEAVLIFKTTEASVPALTEAIKELHSYECPCVAVLPVAGGNAEYLSWIGREVKA